MMPDQKKKTIAFHIAKILETLGCDLTANAPMAKTPERVADMYVDEIFCGLDPTTYPEISFHDAVVNRECVLIKNISLVSFCEHHLVPMVGMAHVAYLPKKGVIGLSKMHRILDHFARRPQLQERLTEEIASNLQQALHTDDVAVVICMKHFCVVARGVEDLESELETHVLSGQFETDHSLRSEFFIRISQELPLKKRGREGKPDSVPS